MNTFLETHSLSKLNIFQIGTRGRFPSLIQVHSLILLFSLITEGSAGHSQSLLSPAHIRNVELAQNRCLLTMLEELRFLLEIHLRGKEACQTFLCQAKKKKKKAKEEACVFIYARVGGECQISTNTSSALLLAKFQGQLTGTGQPRYCPQEENPQTCHYVILLNGRHVPSKCRACDDGALAVWDNECSPSSSGTKSLTQSRGNHYVLFFYIFAHLPGCLISSHRRSTVMSSSSNSLIIPCCWTNPHGPLS